MNVASEANGSPFIITCRGQKSFEYNAEHHVNRPRLHQKSVWQLWHSDLLIVKAFSEVNYSVLWNSDTGELL